MNLGNSGQWENTGHMTQRYNATSWRTGKEVLLSPIALSIQPQFLCSLLERLLAVCVKFWAWGNYSKPVMYLLDLSFPRQDFVSPFWRREKCIIWSILVLLGKAHTLFYILSSCTLAIVCYMALMYMWYEFVLTISINLARLLKFH